MVRFELQEPIDREGPILVKRVALTDQRGSLSRLFCAESLKDFFSSEGVVQINHTVTNKAGTVRGFHFQTGASAEAKLVICLKGRVLDVAVDLRKYSKTLCKTYAAELSPENCNAFLIPRGFAHGFQALEEILNSFTYMIIFMIRIVKVVCRCTILKSTSIGPCRSIICLKETQDLST